MLSPLPRWIGIGGSVTSLSRFGLPRILGGSASTTVLSGPSQGSLALRPARLLQPYRLTSVPRASAGRSPYPTVWVATGMNRQCPGRNFHPLASCALVAHQYIVVHYFKRELYIASADLTNLDLSKIVGFCIEPLMTREKFEISKRKVKFYRRFDL
jgi:hypothetical protein